MKPNPLTPVASPWRRILTDAEVVLYRQLRRRGQAGVLWADEGHLHYAAAPSSTGYYQLADAVPITAGAFLEILNGIAAQPERMAPRAEKRQSRRRVA
jgi:hypothetical protein